MTFYRPALYCLDMVAHPVLYEDSEILLVNKRSGTAVQGGAGIRHPLDGQLSLQCGIKVYPVHRLDKDTAGLILFAKSSVAAAKWTALVGSKAVKKEYAALCCASAAPKKNTGAISADIVHRSVSYKALSRYNIEKISGMYGESDQGYVFLLVRIQLETGRMHQIRIHLAHEGMPIAADCKYGHFARNRELGKLFGIRKLQLAAVSLTVPLDGGNRQFSIPLPEYMENACGRVFDGGSPDAVKNENT